ncbi:MAG TPA: hypothetical protein DCX14_07590 [Flavobacteriales bacterium]|nr:hypothetical protein [Flavobacteriales bacterium]
MKCTVNNAKGFARQQVRKLVCIIILIGAFGTNSKCAEYKLFKETLHRLIAMHYTPSTLEKNVTLNYPSVLFIEREQITNQAQLYIEDNCTISGLVILMDRIDSRTGGSLLQVAKDAIIEGQVYCEGKMDHKGTVLGTIETSGFLLSTPSSIYENHLLDAKIDSENLPAKYGFIFGSEESNEKCIAIWLN